MPHSVMKKSIKNLQESPENKLVKYASKLGFQVTYTPEAATSQVLLTTKENTNFPLNVPLEIIIKTNRKFPEHEIYDFLHELGHYNLCKNWKKYSKEYPLIHKADYEYYENGVTKYRRRVGYYAEMMKDECDAWNEGLKIARKLGIKVNLSKYRKYSAESLAHYVRFYGRKFAG